MLRCTPVSRLVEWTRLQSSRVLHIKNKQREAKRALMSDAEKEADNEATFRFHL